MKDETTPKRAALLRVCGVPMIVTVLLLTSSSDAPAITITVTYSEDIVTSYDPDGLKLLATAQAAASIWAGYFPNNSFSISIDFCYENLSPSETGERLGVADSVNDDISIQASPSAGWFIDSSPWEHSEFDFTGTGSPDNSFIGQTLFRNVGTVNQGAWFNGPVPDLFEIGYRGTAVAPEAQDRFDLFSTVIHEMGHILGVNFDPFDETWDPPSFQLGGNLIEIEPDKDDSGHLAARSSLMCRGCGDTDLRRLPSAVDILAVAFDESWLEVDLPRKDFLVGPTWNNLGFISGWEGGQPPDQGDDVFIRHGGDVTLITSPSVANLFVGENSGVFTDAHTLTVSDLTIVEAFLFEPPYAHITVDTGGRLEGHRLILRGGRLVMAGGEVDFTALDVENNSALLGEVHGHGTVLAGALVNDGVVRADGGTLTLNAIAANLDGAGDLGLVEAITGDLVVTGIVPDFHSLMTIGAGHSIDMNVAWTLDKEGRLNLHGSGAISANLTGATVTVESQVDVDRLGVLATTTVVFDNDAAVTVPDANDRLILDTDAFFMGGSYTGKGAIEQQGDQQFWEDTTIEAREFDWGNSFVGQLHETFLNETVDLTINSATTGTATNEYRGTMHVIGATLNVNLDSSWLLPRRSAGGVPAGTLILNRGDANPPRVTGVPLTVEGFVRANGGIAHMEADFITTSTADIQAVSAAELLLKGHNTFAGGQLYGAGEIGQWGDTDVVTNTTINTTFYDLDGDEAAPSATTIQPGVTFTINSQRIDKPAEFFDGLVTADGGTLAINTPGGWTIGADGEVHLFNDNGPARILGTPLTVDGQITATGGNEILPPVTFRSSAVVAAVASNDILRLRGHTNYEGGAYIGGGIIQDADAFVNAETGMHLGFFDMDGLTENTFIELHDNLFLNVDRIDLNDNRFNGVMEVTDPAELGVNTPQRWEMAGTLNVAGPPSTRFRVSGAEVYLDADVNVHQDNIIEFSADVSGSGNFVGGGDVVMFGGYNPGASPASIQFDGDLTLTDTSSLRMELNGAVPGTDYDQLIVSGNAKLNGGLDVQLLTAAFVPTIGQQFDLITAAGAIDGPFESVNLPLQAGGFNLIWDLQYGGNVLRLELLNMVAGVPGDYNQNGVVDAADYTVWRDTLGSTTNLIADGSGNGTVDTADYNFWRALRQHRRERHV